VDAVPLDPCGYSGTYKLVGGRPSLELVNTVSWPDTDREHDWLQVPANVERWLDAVGLPTVPVAVRHLDDVRAVRAAVTGVLRPLAKGDRTEAGAIDVFNRQLALAVPLRLLDPDLAWAWVRPGSVAEALAPVVVDAAEVAAEADRRRLRYCPACSWVFLDTTRNGRRRWCDMSTCGNRAKAARFRERERGAHELDGDRGAHHGPSHGAIRGRA
jgi:predicted RNA-binding Zn ribbon-like protein